jgi:hypothetical protein
MLFRISRTMNGVEVVVASLNSKIEKLILLHKSALEENRLLADENLSLKMEAEKLKQQISESEHQYKNKQFTEILTENGFEKKELKVRLDAMIGEIDKCLAILNQ